MTIYTIKPGIAAYQHITTDSGEHHSAVYLGPELLDSPDDTQRVEFSTALPPSVKAAVHANFQRLFSVTCEFRQALINAMLTEEVEVQP